MISLLKDNGDERHARMRVARALNFREKCSPLRPAVYNGFSNRVGVKFFFYISRVLTISKTYMVLNTLDINFPLALPSLAHSLFNMPLRVDTLIVVAVCTLMPAEDVSIGFVYLHLSHATHRKPFCMTLCVCVHHGIVGLLASCSMNALPAVPDQFCMKSPAEA